MGWVLLVISTSCFHGPCQFRAPFKMEGASHSPSMKEQRYLGQVPPPPLMATADWLRELIYRFPVKQHPHYLVV